MDYKTFFREYMMCRTARHYFKPPILHRDGRVYCESSTRPDTVLTTHRGQWVIATIDGVKHQSPTLPGLWTTNSKVT